MQNSLTRRRFLRQALATSAAFGGLARLTGSASAGTVATAGTRYGPLVADPAGVMALPKGFSYRVISRAGTLMDDGLRCPGLQDGAACFAVPGDPSRVVLVINHEVGSDHPGRGPFGADNAGWATVDPGRVYDGGRGKTPAPGGCSSVVYHLPSGTAERRFMSLMGTERNCAGGPTPWGSWLTCEETVTVVDAKRERDHGFVFEVPATAEMRAADPVALTAMGRMNHEACAVDPRTGMVYLTEDRQDGALYRFIPDVPGGPGRSGDLAAGGRLQALAMLDRPAHDTRNWLVPVTPEEKAEAAAKEAAAAAAGDHMRIQEGDRSAARTPVGESLAVRWIDVENVRSPKDDLRHQVFAKGAARFARGEGMWWSEDGFYFAATTGGLNRKGQIWRYTPSPEEGNPGEDRAPGRVELFLEPNDHELVENADNLTVAPWGDLVVSEDAGHRNELVGVTPEGVCYRLAENTGSKSEFAGSCFSPDGSTLFTNIQGEGLTLAITGPW